MKSSSAHQPTFNVYCDESCHLAHGGQVWNEQRMVIAVGGVWCPQAKVREITTRLQEIKAEHGINPVWEIKWNKVSPSKEKAFLAILDYFFDDDDLHFRAAIVPDKAMFLEKYGQATLQHEHDEPYYRLYFDMLKVFFAPYAHYNVYLDAKDTRGRFKLAGLREKLCNNPFYEVPEGLIGNLHEVRSMEVPLMQITDLLLGALTFAHRRLDQDPASSSAKRAFVDRLKERSGYSLMRSTLHGEPKVNLYIWHNSHHPFDKVVVTTTKVQSES